MAQFAATEGLIIETSRADVSYDLICDLYLFMVFGLWLGGDEKSTLIWC